MRNPETRSKPKLELLAVRLVRADQGEDDVPKPRVPEFRRWLTASVRTTRQATAIDQEQEETNKPLLKTLQEFVESSRLQVAFTRFRDLIDYRRENPLDSGLPKVYVPYLNLSAMQVVLRWIDLHRDCDPAFFQSNRMDILRFLLFWHIAVDNDAEASKSAFRIVQSDHNLPGHLLYNTLTTRNEKGQTFARCLPSPQTLRIVLGTKTGQLRTWIERFDPGQRQDDEEKSAIIFLQRWWSAKELLLWLQRQWADRWFEGYDPLAGRDEDTPYDYDHILPRDHWLYWSPDSQFSDTEARKRFHQWRDVIGHALGNYRVWLSALNRGDGAESPKVKLKLESKLCSLDGDDWPKNLKTPRDLLAASAMNTADLALWRKASGDNKNYKQWSYDRIEAFQTAIENRTASLYERFYNELHFAAWI